MKIHGFSLRYFSTGCLTHFICRIELRMHLDSKLTNGWVNRNVFLSFVALDKNAVCSSFNQKTVMIKASNEMKAPRNSYFPVISITNQFDVQSNCTSFFGGLPFEFLQLSFRNNDFWPPQLAYHELKLIYVSDLIVIKHPISKTTQKQTNQKRFKESLFTCHVKSLKS